MGWIRHFVFLGEELESGVGKCDFGKPKIVFIIWLYSKWSVNIVIFKI